MVLAETQMCRWLLQLSILIRILHASDCLYYAKKLGVKVEDLMLSQPDYGEQALEIAEVLIRSGAVNFHCY